MKKGGERERERKRRKRERERGRKKEKKCVEMNRLISWLVLRYELPWLQGWVLAEQSRREANKLEA